MPGLKQLGIVQKNPFEIACESAMTLEEARKLLHKKIEKNNGESDNDAWCLTKAIVFGGRTI